MKKLEYISIATFLIGIIIKMLHWKAADITLLIGCSAFLIVSLTHFIKKISSNASNAFVHLSYSLWTIYLLFRLLYWPGGPILILGMRLIFILPLVVSINSLILHILYKTKVGLPQIGLIIFTGFSIWLSYLQSYHVFYFFYLNPVVHHYTRESDAISWDRYSWFLYISNKDNEAVIANAFAIYALKNSGDKYTEIEQLVIKKLLDEHRYHIINKDWKSFP